MSLQVHDPRSRTRTRTRSRSRSRERGRDSRGPSPSPSRDRSPVVEIAPRSPSRNYDPNGEAEIERQYKLMKESRLRESDQRDNIESRGGERAPRSPVRYDVVRSDEDEDPRRRDRGPEKRDSRRREDRFEHSDGEDDVRAKASEYSGHSHSRKPSSPSRASRLVDSDEDSVDDDLAYGDMPGSHPSYARPSRYQYAQPAQFLHAQTGAPRQSAYAEDRSDWAPIPECERPGFVPPASQAGPPSTMPGGFPTTYTDVPAMSASTFPAPQYAGLPSHQPSPYAHGSTASYMPSHYRTASAGDAAQPPPTPYAQPAQYQYAQVDPNIRYTSKATPVRPYSASSQPQFGKSQPLDQPVYPYRYSHEPQFVEKPQLQPQPQLQPHVVEITPGGGRSGGRPHSLSVSSNNHALTGANAGHTGHAPVSPLLEPYQGTYQSMSPMPSPIVMPVREDDISDLEPSDGVTSTSESGRRKKHSSKSEKDSRHKNSKEKIKEKEKEKDNRKDDKRRSRPTDHDRLDSTSSTRNDSILLISPTTGRKRVSFYDAAADASAMQSALNHTRNADHKTIIQVLPRLTSDEIILLRAEYKNKVKMHGKGINLAKHLRLKLGTSPFGKVAYATALGRWESEAFWANCYYQAGTSRRELLIESLMGRSNAAIREIKSCFRDSRYDNSLERCMRSELRADKFRTAVLLALEGRRQDEREPVEARLVRRDVSDLYRALVSREGGETAMIYIIVLRSDAHLREVLRAYEAVYGHNFARAMIAKSRNLVVCSTPSPLSPIISPCPKQILTLIPPGRNTSSHPQRRHKPPHARRPPPPPSASRIPFRPRTLRATYLAACTATLGAAASGTGQGGVSEEVWGALGGGDCGGCYGESWGW